MHRHTETSSYTYVVGTNTHIIYIETIVTVLYKEVLNVYNHHHASGTEYVEKQLTLL